LHDYFLIYWLLVKVPLWLSAAVTANFKNWFSMVGGRLVDARSFKGNA